MHLLCETEYPIRRLGIFGQHHGNKTLKKSKQMSFLSEVWRIMKNDQPSSNLELPYFVPFEIYVYIIFWDIIYSLQEMNSTTVWGGWCFPFGFGCLVGFVLFAISFSLVEKDTSPCENPTWHSPWKASCRWTPGIWGILTILSQELPSASTWWPKEAHRLVLLLSTLCNISMQAWLT